MNGSTSRKKTQGLHRATLPEHIRPMLALLSDLPEDQDSYAFEYKWDGVRAILFFEGQKLKIETRNLHDVTAGFPELAGMKDALRGRSAVLDGEIIAIGKGGYPSFLLLSHRLGLVDSTVIRERAAEIPVVYMIFDVLYLDGRNLMKVPYAERRTILEGLRLSGPKWRTPVSGPGDGDAMLQAARENKLEGVVAKRLTSPYREGKRTSDWLKIKIVRSQEFVICGYMPTTKGTGAVGSLLLGYYEGSESGASEATKNAEGAGARLRYAGKVGTGFTDLDRPMLAGLLDERRRPDSPFADKIPERGSVVFAEPDLVAQVEFRGWSPTGRLRQPSFKGLRLDKTAAEVVREEKI